MKNVDILGGRLFLDARFNINYILYDVTFIVKKNMLRK